MNAQFILIQEYPGSPRLGTTIERIHGFDTPYNYGCKGFITSALNVESHNGKNQKFWKQTKK